MLGVCCCVAALQCGLVCAVLAAVWLGWPAAAFSPFGQSIPVVGGCVNTECTTPERCHSPTAPHRRQSRLTTATTTGQPHCAPTTQQRRSRRSRWPGERYSISQYDPHCATPSIRTPSIQLITCTASTSSSATYPRALGSFFTHTLASLTRLCALVCVSHLLSDHSLAYVRCLPTGSSLAQSTPSPP